MCQVFMCKLCTQQKGTTMKTSRILVVAIIVGWVAAMAVIGYNMMNDNQQTSVKSVNESTK